MLDKIKCGDSLKGLCPEKWPLVKESSGFYAPYGMATEIEYINMMINLIKILDAKKILEIGTFMGYTSYFLADAIASQNGHLDTVDIKKQHIGFKTPYLKQHIMSSDEFFEQCETTYDFIYIDGDHSFNQAYCDLNNAIQHLCFGGMICVHDISFFMEVKNAVELIKEELGGCWIDFTRGKGLSIGQF